jgi:hypothetical protein|tara:strand:- start:914 stop:1183 length:270 start_codon:yes stop_codon:yes gene_type:complete
MGRRCTSTKETTQETCYTVQKGRLTLSFLNALTQPERDALRRIVRIVHMKHHPKDFQTDYEADKMIEAIGPEIAGRMIKVGIDHGINNK